MNKIENKPKFIAKRIIMGNVKQEMQVTSPKSIHFYLGD